MKGDVNDECKCLKVNSFIYISIVLIKGAKKHSTDIGSSSLSTYLRKLEACSLRGHICGDGLHRS